MPKYELAVSCFTFETIEVEAKDEEEAYEKVGNNEVLNDADDYEIESIHVIPDNETPREKAARILGVSLETLDKAVQNLANQVGQVI